MMNKEVKLVVHNIDLNNDIYFKLHESARISTDNYEITLTCAELICAIETYYQDKRREINECKLSCACDDNND